MNSEVERLERELAAARERAAGPLVACDREQVERLGACTYWLGSLYRRGGPLPAEIGRDIAREAHCLRGELLLTPRPRLLVVPPLPRPYRAVYQFMNDQAAFSAASWLGKLGSVTLAAKCQVRLVVGGAQ